MDKPSIAVIVDSGCDLQADYLAKENVFILPFRIIYKDGEYISKKTITTEEIVRRLPEEIPTTSLPSGEDILHAFDAAADAGYEAAIVVNISSRLSGTNNLVNLMAKSYDRLPIYVFDTKSIGIGSGFFAMDAIDCIDRGMAFDDVCRRLEAQIAESRPFINLSTLEYLQKGGRIGLVSSLLGSALQIKPIITTNAEGVYYTLKKARGRDRSLAQLVNVVIDFARETDRPFQVALCKTNPMPEYDSICEQIRRALPDAERFLEIEIDPALTIHTGPDLIGIGVYRLPKEDQ